jgi:hypothetical protein
MSWRGCIVVIVVILLNQQALLYVQLGEGER